MPNTQHQMKDHNIVIATMVAVTGYIASGLSWLIGSVNGMIYFAVDPETLKLWGPMAVALFTALLGKGVDVWLKLREERRRSHTTK